MDDVPSLALYANNRKIWLNLRDAFPHPYTESNARDFIEMVSQQSPPSVFAIATETEVIGSIGLMLGQDVHRITAELGYWLAEPYWNRGIVTEAIQRFVEFAFPHFKLKRIFAEPYANNPSSARVLEKAGFQLEGVMRSHAVKDGKVLDMLLYSMIRP